MEDRTYRKYDQYLQNVNRIITPTSNDIREYGDSFGDVFFKFRQLLCETDPLLKSFGKIIYVGSNANNLKIGLPDEYDMNLCIKLPKDIYNTAKILNSEVDGYIQIKVSELDKLKKHQNWNTYKSVDKWIDQSGYLLQKDFHNWMESIVTKTVNKLPINKNVHILQLDNGEKYTIQTKKSGPAFTLVVHKQSNNIHFDVDIVPALYFEPPLWPTFIKHKHIKLYKTTEWYAIAKPFAGDVNVNKFWRPSLTRQEIEILAGYNNLKSTIRLLKSLRDVHEMSYVASYFINTLFLLETSEVDNREFWNKPLSFLFVYMLKKFIEAIDKGVIPNYWCKNQNILKRLSQDQIKDCAIKLHRILNFIEKNYNTNPEMIEQIICGKKFINKTSLIPEVQPPENACIIL